MACRAVSDYNTKGGKWCADFNDGLENAGRLLKFVESTFRIAQAADELGGTKHKGFKKAVKVFDTAGATVSAMRVLNSIHKFLSGQAFVRNGEVRSWSDIVFDILLFVGRVFSSILYFCKLGLGELGKHAKWMGLTALSAFAAVTTIQVVKSVQDAVEDPNPKKSAKNVLEILSSVLDFAAFPWDAGLGFNSNPAVALVGAIFSLFSAGIYLVKEWFYFNAFQES